MSGYHRDYQVLKELLFPSMHRLASCLDITRLMLQHIEVREDALTGHSLDELFSVEEVNRLVMQGVPFREAYLRVKQAIADGTFSPGRTVKHTHEGSSGNLCLPEIRRMKDEVMKHFRFEQAHEALGKLLNPDH